MNSKQKEIKRFFLFTDSDIKVLGVVCAKDEKTAKKIAYNSLCENDIDTYCAMVIREVGEEVYKEQEKLLQKGEELLQEGKK